MLRGARRAPSVRDMEPWQPATPRLRPFRVILGWAVAAASVWVAAAIVPGVALDSTGAAFLVAAVIAVLNAVLPPVLAALRLPFMLAIGFLLVLVATPPRCCSRATCSPTTSTSTRSATRCSPRS